MKKYSIFHLSLVIISFFSPLMLGRGNLIRSICKRLLAAKLKTKSSKSSSAALGMGISLISAVSESVAIVSRTSKESATTSSVFFVLLPPHELKSVSKALIAIRYRLIIRMNSMLLSKFCAKIVKILISHFSFLIFFVPLHQNLRITVDYDT